jgi:hypothetical protein
MPDFDPIVWQDHIVDQNGNVVQQGTPISALNLNRMEGGIEFSHDQIGGMLVVALQEIAALKTENKTLYNQKLLQGQATITSPGGTYFNTAYPYVLVSLPASAYSLLNAPNYEVVLEVLSADDVGKVGVLTAFDKTQNGFKVQFTGSATSVTFMWTIINPNVK